MLTAESPSRRVAESPSRRVAESPSRRVAEPCAAAERSPGRSPYRLPAPSRRAKPPPRLLRDRSTLLRSLPQHRLELAQADPPVPVRVPAPDPRRGLGLVDRLAEFGQRRREFGGGDLAVA